MSTTLLFKRLKLALLASLALLFVGGLGGALLTITAQPTRVHAADPVCRTGQVPDRDHCIVPDLTKCEKSQNNCVCDPSLPNCNVKNTCTGNDCGLIDKYLNPIINFLAGAVGVVCTIAIVVGGIEYSSSADDPSKVQRAKSRIINAVLALLAFFFLWAFLQWLIPGGLL
jgi:hypothetical protein